MRPGARRVVARTLFRLADAGRSACRRRPPTRRWSTARFPDPGVRVVYNAFDSEAIGAEAAPSGQGADGADRRGRGRDHAHAEGPADGGPDVAPAARRALRDRRALHPRGGRAPRGGRRSQPDGRRIPAGRRARAALRPGARLLPALHARGVRLLGRRGDAARLPAGGERPVRPARGGRTVRPLRAARRSRGRGSGPATRAGRATWTSPSARAPGSSASSRVTDAARSWQRSWTA